MTSTSPRSSQGARPSDGVEPAGNARPAAVDRVDRAAGALLGLAAGDALGMPLQSVPAAEVRRRHGAITGFGPGPPDQPISPGTPAATVTDDTEQALLLARLLVEGGGHLDPWSLAAALTAWEEQVRERGSLDTLGPSTRAALRALADGVDPSESGRAGTTNGAAMRVAPVGIAVPLTGASTHAAGVQRLVDAVVETATPTHGTSVAIAGACAVAAAVSAGIGGASTEEALDVAVEAAALGARHGRWVASADVAARTRWATSQVAGRGPDEVTGFLVDLVGTSLATAESVPAALAVASRHPRDPWAAACAAASLGGDADTIAAMAGAVVGACCGASVLPTGVRERLMAANPSVLGDLDAVVTGLLRLRVCAERPARRL